MINITENCDNDLVLHVVNDESLHRELTQLEDELDIETFINDLEYHFQFNDDQRQMMVDHCIEVIEENTLKFNDVINSFINGQFSQFIEQAEQYDDENYDFLESLEITDLISDVQKIKALKILLKNYSTF